MRSSKNSRRLLTCLCGAIVWLAAMPTALSEEAPPVDAAPAAPNPAEPPRVVAGDKADTVTLQASDADLVDLLRLIATHADLNLILDPNVTGKVNVSLKNVPLDAALRMILQSNACIMQREGDILRVMKSQQTGEAVQSKQFQLKALALSDIQAQLPQFLSDGGKVVLHPQQNSFVVVDRPDVLATIEAFLASADAREQQVMIEAHLVEVGLDKRDQFGFSWNWLDGRLETQSIRGTISQSLLPEATQFRVGVSNEHFNTIFQALQTHGNTNLLSSPTITTVNNKEAKVEITEDIPYIQATTTIDSGAGSGGTTTSTSTVEFVTVGVKLTVLPEIGNDNYIKMKVTPEVSEAPTRYQGVPVVKKRTADATVLVQSGQTLVMGGLIRENLSDTEYRVPILSSIPLLGNLFKSKDKTITKVELLIFVKPLILTNDLAALEVKEDRERLEQKRMEFSNPPILPKARK